MSRSADAPFDVTRTETVPESARVRHFDELDDSTQESLVRATDGESRRATGLSELREGDVVVFTDYYQVQ